MHYTVGTQMRDDFTEDVKRVIANRASLVCSNPLVEAQPEDRRVAAILAGK